jgi:DNA-binding NarL/FixJ family response regulator
MTSRRAATANNTGKGKTAKVLIVDDHPAVREGLALLLSRQPDLKVCGEAADVPEALKLVSQSRPDIVIVDISLKNGNGIDLIKRIKARDVSIRMLVWSMYSESLCAERALRAGALGYINKEQATDDIINAIRDVLNDKVFVSKTVSDRVLHRTIGRAAGGDLQSSPIECLSDRELEVFKLIGQGMNTEQVAEKMRISPKTVQTYRGRIKQKLRIGRSPQLVQRAVEWVLQTG